LKILEVSSFMPPHPGGLELVVDNLTRGLIELGHSVRWLASAEPLPAGWRGHQIRVAAWNALEDRYGVPLPIWGPAGHAQLVRQCRWADVVHVHDCLYPSSAAAVLVAKACGRPVVMTQHIAAVPYGSALFNRVQATAYRTLGKALLASVDRVVTYSRHVPDYFARIGVGRPFELIPLGFDARFRMPSDDERRQLRIAWQVPAPAKAMLFAGRLVGKKGIKEVAEVHRALAPEGLLLLVAGSGPLAGCLHGIPQVRHVQQVPYERMHELYGLADVLLLPSHGEGLPLTLQEAMLCGTPAVVSTDPSYVANLRDAPGVWMAEGVPQLAAAVRTALATPPARATVAKWAHDTWGRPRFIREYERVLRESAERH
jgi:glycosyltransferase involved in cell wall biosynthesis